MIYVHMQFPRCSSFNGFISHMEIGQLESQTALVLQDDIGHDTDALIRFFLHSKPYLTLFVKIIDITV